MFAVANSALINMLMASRLVYGMSRERVLPAALVVRRRQLVPTSELGEPHGHCRRLLTAGYLPTASDH
jgi:hypothetical protein